MASSTWPTRSFAGFDTNPPSLQIIQPIGPIPVSAPQQNSQTLLLDDSNVKTNPPNPTEDRPSSLFFLQMMRDNSPISSQPPNSEELSVDVGDVEMMGANDGQHNLSP